MPEEKSLYALIRLRKWEVDEKRRALGDLFREEEKTLQAIETLKQTLMAEAENARLNPRTSWTFPEYARRMRERREALEEDLARLREQIELVREDLAESFRDLKSSEILQERRDERARKEVARKEQIALDEVGQDIRRRRKNGEEPESSPPGTSS